MTSLVQVLRGQTHTETDRQTDTRTDTNKNNKFFAQQSDAQVIIIRNLVLFLGDMLKYNPQNKTIDIQSLVN